jgi:hypothetical protein
VGERARGGTLVTHRLARNASLTLAINYLPLQRTAEARRHLEGFLRTHRFTHLVYMQPHPDCFFDRQMDPRLPKCVDFGDAPGDASRADNARPPHGGRTPRAALPADGAPREPSTEPSSMVARPLQWRIASTHVRTALYTFAWKAWKADVQRAVWNRTSPLPSARTIMPAPVVAQPCLMSGCDGHALDGLAGHQCLPGSATLVSRDIVRAVRRTHTNELRRERERQARLAAGRRPV